MARLPKTRQSLRLIRLVNQIYKTSGVMDEPLSGVAECRIVHECGGNYISSRDGIFVTRGLGDAIRETVGLKKVIDKKYALIRRTRAILDLDVKRNEFIKENFTKPLDSIVSIFDRVVGKRHSADIPHMGVAAAHFWNWKIPDDKKDLASFAKSRGIDVSGLHHGQIRLSVCVSLKDEFIYSCNLKRMISDFLVQRYFQICFKSGVLANDCWRYERKISIFVYQNTPMLNMTETQVEGIATNLSSKFIEIKHDISTERSYGERMINFLKEGTDRVKMHPLWVGHTSNTIPEHLRKVCVQWISENFKKNTPFSEFKNNHLDSHLRALSLVKRDIRDATGFLDPSFDMKQTLFGKLPGDLLEEISKHLVGQSARSLARAFIEFRVPVLNTSTRVFPSIEPIK